MQKHSGDQRKGADELASSSYANTQVPPARGPQYSLRGIFLWMTITAAVVGLWMSSERERFPFWLCCLGGFATASFYRQRPGWQWLDVWLPTGMNGLAVVALVLITSGRLANAYSLLSVVGMDAVLPYAIFLCYVTVQQSRESEVRWGLWCYFLFSWALWLWPSILVSQFLGLSSAY